MNELFFLPLPAHIASTSQPPATKPIRTTSHKTRSIAQKPQKAVKLIWTRWYVYFVSFSLYFLHLFDCLRVREFESSIVWNNIESGNILAIFLWFEGLKVREFDCLRVWGFESLIEWVLSDLSIFLLSLLPSQSDTNK